MINITTPIDTRVFRDALSHYASGITIISSMVDDTPVGFTCQSFHSVSIEPPLVSFSVMKTSSSWPKIRSQKKFAINVLSSDQTDLSNTFARPSPNRWQKVQWTRTINGNPLIDGTLFSLDCSLYDEHEAGDHWIIVSKVHNLHNPTDQNNRAPLVFFKGRYRQLAKLEDV